MNPDCTIPPEYWLAIRYNPKLAIAIAKASWDDEGGKVQNCVFVFFRFVFGYWSRSGIGSWVPESQIAR